MSQTLIPEDTLFDLSDELRQDFLERFELNWTGSFLVLIVHILKDAARTS